MRTKSLFVLISLCVFICLVGCGQAPAPKLVFGSQKWKPPSAGGAIEVRPLPAPWEIEHDYEQWIESDATSKVRIYEVKVDGAENQSDFRSEMTKGETPLGQSETTFVSFLFRHQSLGQYRISWHLRGRHNADFLKFDASPTIIWVRPLMITDRDGKIPELQIVAVEGVEAWQTLVASP